MNCEKCKNKKATLFYADENGVKHALCASCGAIQGKLVGFSAQSSAPLGNPIYIPESGLLSLSSYALLFATLSPDEDKRACKGCGAKLSELKAIDGMGCPECYAAFSDAIFPTLRPTDGGGRIPISLRERLEKRNAINEARSKLKEAIESESFELAAALRDKIRELEGRSV